MKKNFLIFALSLSSFFTMAQTNKFSLGILTSYDACKYSFKSPDVPYYNYESKNGSTLGLRMQYNITEKFHLKTGIQYSVKGYALSYNNYKVLDPGDPLQAVSFDDRVQDLKDRKAELYKFNRIKNRNTDAFR